MSPASFLASIGFDLKAFEADLEARRVQEHPHYAPSDEPLSWDVKGKVITLDHALMATHLMTDRLVFGGFRSIVDQLLRLVITRVQNKLIDLGEGIVAKVTGQWKKNVDLAFTLGQVFVLDQIEASKEQKIRKSSLDAQRGLWKAALAKAKFIRRKRRVLTRHPSPKQRRANRNWHNVRPNRT